MIAIDTNVIVRYLVGDHPQQMVRAREVIDRQAVFVSVTVILEVEWVLRSIYRFTRAEIFDAFVTFAGMPSVTIEDRNLVAEALDLFADGMDFADALHLLKAQDCDAFLTFDRQFVKLAQAAGQLSVQEA